MNKPRFQRLRAFAGCAALLLSPALTGCGTSNSNDTASGANLPRAVADARQRNTPVDATLVSRDNAFGFTLFDTLRGNQASSNVFISPVSLSLALQILYNGANSSTQQAMATTLQLSGLSVSDLNNANAALQASLVSPDAQVQLTVANSLWTRDGAVVPAFVQANQTYYGSKLGSTTGAPANVNAWVNAQTQGRIATILPDGDYSRTIAIIANAVYFKGKWTDKFDVANTQTATFTLPDGSTQSCQLMTRTGGYDYFAGSNFQMARLPYGSKRLSMIVLVPNTGIDLNTVLAGANAQTWAGWVAQLKPSNGTVQLPRFTSAYAADLKSPLTALGMGIAFDPNAADFSGLAVPSVGRAYISAAYHKTYVKVDEEGTEAAAATGIVVSAGGALAPEFTIRMDHPFFYAIRDDQTGILLFMGLLANPNTDTAG